MVWYPYRHITQGWRNDNVFITSKRRRRRRFDVVKTLLLRRVPAGMKTTYVDGFEYRSCLNTLSSGECRGWFDVINNSVHSHWTLQLHKITWIGYCTWGFSWIFIHDFVIWIKTIYDNWFLQRLNFVDYFHAIKYRLMTGDVFKIRIWK